MTSPRNTTDAPQRAARPRHFVVGALGAVVIAATLTACQADPVSAPALAPRAPSLAKGGIPGKPEHAGKSAAKQPKGAKAPDVRTFVYDPSRKLVQSFGNGHQVTLPAGAVCDPATSGYGVTMWDAPCKPLTKPITFTVTSWDDVTGRPNAEFSPDVRFVPGAVVILELTDRGPKGKNPGGTIFWCPTGSALCYDESDDAAVRTNVKGSGNVFVRQLKHFSGYNVILGFGGDDSEGLL